MDGCCLRVSISEGLGLNRDSSGFLSSKGRDQTMMQFETARSHPPKVGICLVSSFSSARAFVSAPFAIHV